MPIKPSRHIDNADDYMDYATQLLETFLESFTIEDGLIRDVTEDDAVPADECYFMYTEKGCRLAEKMRDKLIEVGEAHFPNDDIEITTSMLQEY